MKTRQAHASIVLLNYTQRGGSGGMKSADVTATEPAVLLDREIMSISVTKQKSAPSGRFEFSLAPTKNWIAHITPGSWLFIHMAPRIITKGDIEGSSIETLKMIGRVDSVRVSVQVDPSTGARQTMYRVQGRDWGQFFESSMYIDSAAAFGNDTPFVQATKIAGGLITNTNPNGTGSIKSTTELVQMIIAIYAGKGLTERVGGPLKAGFSGGVSQLTPKYVFSLPKDFGTYADITPDNSLTNSIRIVPGKLTGYDTYTDQSETVGVPMFNMMVGTNQLWGLINAHSCDVINETIAELRWETDKPSLCLYKRIKPFMLKPPGSKTVVKVGGIAPADFLKVSDGAARKIQSSFFDVKRANIDLEDIMSLELGNNWQDSANFIEVLPDPSIGMNPDGGNAIASRMPALKSQSNSNDSAEDSFVWARDGLRPLLFNTKFFPTNTAGTIDILAQTKWLPTIKGWYFDTHKMLNGTVTMIGRGTYIGVGDNIMFPSVVAGYTQYVSAGQETPSIASEKKSNILGHVEGISHTFTVQPGGARNFVTTVNFSRGVIANKDGTDLLDSGAGPYGIDTDGTILTNENKKHTNVTGGGN